MQNLEFIDNFLSGVADICTDIQRESIDAAIEVLFTAWKRGGAIFVMGNGGSASTASHFACDLNKCTICEGKPRMKVSSLVDNVPLVSALVNDNGWENVYTEQLRNFFRRGDILVGFSVHGGSGKDRAGLWSQNLLSAMQYVKDNGGKTLGFSGFDGGAMKEIADVCVVVPYNTTPHVESFHVVLHHLIAFCLAEKIREHNDNGTVESS